MKTRPSVSCLLPVVWLLASALGSYAQTLTVTNDLQLWLRADAGVTTNASGGVTQWEDQSGNANHATQVTTTQAPLLVNAQLNNRSVLRFDGTDDFLNVADSESLSFSGDLTTLCVIKFNDFANYNAVWGKTAGNLPAPTDLYTLPGSGFVRAYRGNGTSANLSHVDSAQPLGAATYLVLGVEVAGETLTHYLRNQPNGSGTVNTDTADANTDLTIGTRQDRFTQLKGELAELLIYSRALSPSERSNVFNYLQTKYALPLVVTHLGDSGPGSLRQAIADASSGDTITFATSGTITLTSGQLFITKDLTIVGPGPANLAVSGNNSTRVLSIGVGSAVNISGLTVRNGLFFSGGGVQNSGTLVMSNCVITANATFDGSTSGTGGTGGIGAGIYNAGALTLIACTVSNNRAGHGRNGDNGGDGGSGPFQSPHGIPGTGGGSGGDGGGIYNVGPLSLIACTVNNNATGDGGAGGNGGNGALGADFPPFGDGGGAGAGGEGGFGGGVYNGASASLTLSNCTLYGNSAGRGGRGGNGGAPYSTFAGSGTGGRGGSGGEAGNGGGVYNADLAELALTACTASSNSAGAGGAGGVSGPGNIVGGQGRRGGDGGGIYTLSVVPTALRNSLVASNHPGVRGQGGPTFAQVGRGADLHGTNFVSHGHNLVGNNDTYFVLLNQNSTDIVPADYYQTNPLLAALGDNGGPTLTVALLRGSPAIDAGDDTLANTLATDQRGASRQSGAHVDIGAFEAQIPIVLNTNDSGPGSLRDTLLDSSPLETITFDPSLSGRTIQLTSGQLTISKSFVVNASALAGGVVISAGGNSRVLEIAAGASATLDSLILMNGRAVSGGGILVNSGGALSLNRTTLSGNSAAFGGGIASYGTLTVRASTIVGNFGTNNSGGLENDGGTMIIEGSIISSNSAVVFGGGIANWFSGTLTVSGCTVVHNFAAYSGGGIYNNSSTLGLNNSTLFGNSAPLGGGISNEDTGAVVLNSSTISANSATSGADSGGGIRNPLGTCMLTNAIVAGNTANNISGSFSGVNNLTKGNPLLASLANYGGPTPTIPPLAGSPAIDAGTDSVTNFLATDQRGYPRLSGARVDIGAVEAQAAPLANSPLLINPTSRVNALSFDFDSVSNADFSVLGSTNLVLWEVLGPALHGPPGQYRFTDAQSANYPRRFYKVTSP